MELEIREFIEYLHNTKKTSQNTEVSYQRDLNKMSAYLETKGITAAADVREFDLLGYMDYMEKENFASSTISRSKGVYLLLGPSSKVRATFFFS